MFSGSQSQIPSKTNFGELTQNTYSYVAQLPYEQEYIESLLRTKLKTFNVEFSTSILSTRPGTFDCTYKDKDSNLQLWYDERKIVKDNFGKETDKKYDACLPGFSKELETKIKDYFSQTLTQELGVLGTDSNKAFSVDIVSSNTQGQLLLKIKSDFSRVVSTSDIVSKKEYFVPFNVGDYTLLASTFETSLPELSKALKEKVPELMAKTGTEKYSLDTAVSKVTTDFFVSKGIAIDKYKFEVTLTSFDEDKQYLFFKIKVSNLANEEILTVPFVIEDSIPNYYLKFGLDTNSLTDNAIVVSIDQTTVTDDVSKYIVLYSYEDFLSPGYSSLSKLLGLLDSNFNTASIEKSQIPSNELLKELDTTSIKSIRPDLKYEHYISNEASGLNLNALIVEPQDRKDYPIQSAMFFQIYDFATKKFMPLDTGKKVYVYVFALDKNYNYYLKDITGKTQSKLVEKVLGPKPLVYGPSSSQTSVPINVVIPASTDKVLDGLQNTLVFKIVDYPVTIYDSFEMTIVKDDGSLTNCNPSNCYKITAQIPKTVTDYYKITSDQTLTGPGVIQIPKTQLGTAFIENGKQMGLYIIPVLNGKKVNQTIDTFPVSCGDKFCSLIESLLTVTKIPFVPIDKKPPVKTDVELTQDNPFNVNQDAFWKIAAGSLEKITAIHALVSTQIGTETKWSVITIMNAGNVNVQRVVGSYPQGMTTFNILDYIPVAADGTVDDSALKQQCQDDAGDNLQNCILP